MTVEVAQLLALLAIAAVLTSYARVLFSACKKIARATGILFCRELPARSPSNVTRVMAWRGPPIKPLRRYEVLAVMFLATAAAVVSIGWVALSTATSARLITTGANESTTAKLAGGNVLLSLGAHSTVKLDPTAQRYAAYLVEGEGMFEVAGELPKPFVVETFLARATAAPGAQFRVAVDPAVEIEVYEGVVQVAPRGAKVGAIAIMLRKGESYRIPVLAHNRAAPLNGSRLADARQAEKTKG